MSKLSLCRPAAAVLAVLFPAAAWADLSGTTTLSANAILNLDTGATVTSGGDLQFTGSTITPKGTASVYNFGSGAAVYSSLNQQTVSSIPVSIYSQTPISGSSLAANNVLLVHTNGANFAKVLITAVSGTSLTLQYTTFGVSGGGGGAGGPSISAVLNNYSGVLPGLPNYGISPGTLFIIYGSGLSNPAITTVTGLQNSQAAGGLPLTLNGASVTVTVNGTTTHPAFYYAIPTQLAVVLPSNTPVGTGTITVSYNNVTSAAAQIQVVTSALGLDTYYQTGNGLGLITNANYQVFNYNNSASPGQTIILWGSGLGADLADSDVSYAAPGHAVNVPLHIYIGGIDANVSYAGGSGYPGLNQINVIIPQNVQAGCGVSIVGVIGNIVSNTISLPINQGGGICSDPVLGYNGNQILTQGGQTTYTQGSVGIFQGTFLGTTESIVDASFFKYQGAQSASGYGLASLGSCIVTEPLTATGTTSLFTSTGLDAGTITVTGPTGTVTLTESPNTGGSGPSGLYYSLPTGTFLPSTGGTFTFKGSGGADVGQFTATLSYANPLTWTNMSSITSITRSQGVTVTWTGGAAGSYVFISGSSTSTAGSVSFTCYAPASAGQFTVPSYVTLALPVSSSNGGSLSLFNFTNPQSFTASGITAGYGEAGVEFEIAPSYN